MFYWALMNIKNFENYTLSAIQLLAVTKYELLKNEKSFSVLDDFIEAINKLNDPGLEVKV